MGGIRTSPTGDALPQQDVLAAGRLVGQSPAIGIIKEIASGIAGRRSTVMVLGETGTGKEMLARHIHALSDRSANPFIPVDCSALTDTLFESQLFGHVRGAFTGAVRESLGFVRAADTGTLFLDEIGELSAPSQAKLLRVIQERCVVPVGETRPKSVDVRFICATHRDLRQMVREGTFREDLFFRLNVIVLNVPPLRERPCDIVPLARHFVKQQADLYDEPIKQITAEAAALLQSYGWPGNVRELANAMEHAYVLSSSDTIEAADLPDRLRAVDAMDRLASELRLVDVERRTIAEALRRTQYRKLAACRLLGINIQRLNRYITRLGIRMPE